MLVLTRKVGKSIRIGPAEEADLSVPLGELFEEGPIEIRVIRSFGHQVQVGVWAPPALLILRSELEAGRPTHGDPMPPQARRLLARKVRTLRRLKRWSQDDLARIARVPRERIAELEHPTGHKISLADLDRLATALDISLGELLWHPYDSPEDS